VRDVNKQIKTHSNNSRQDQILDSECTAADFEFKNNDKNMDNNFGTDDSGRKKGNTSVM
jgi:hypothetical protein